MLLDCRCLGLHLYSVRWVPKHHQSLYNPLTDTCWVAAAYAGSAFLSFLARANGYCYSHEFYQLGVISWTAKVTVQGPFAFTTKDRANCFSYILSTTTTPMVILVNGLDWFLMDRAYTIFCIFSLGEGLKLFRRKLWSVDWYLNASWGNCSPSECHHPRRPSVQQNSIQHTIASIRDRVKAHDHVDRSGGDSHY